MAARSQVALLCLDPERVSARTRRLTDAGFRVVLAASRSSGLVGKLTAAAPLALVIDLDSKPAYGRDIAIFLRNSQSVRHVPLVFAGGAAEKVGRVRAEIPDAMYCAWDEVKAGVETATGSPPVRPVRPQLPGKVVLRGSALAKKFGIKAEMPVAILGDVIGLGGRLQMEYEEHVHAETGIALAVVRTARDLDATFEALAAQLPLSAAVWIIHPKQSGGLRSDFTQKDVIARGLRFGFSGFKMCAVDADWSGLRLVRKKRR
jgi:hypothetical protein